MALFVEELIDYLVTKTVVVKDTTGFVFSMPPDKTGEIVVINETGGIPGKGIPNPWITTQIMVRGDLQGIVVARRKAAEVFTCLHEVADVTTTSYRILTSRALATPQYVGEDKGHRPIFSATIQFNIVSLAQADGGGDDGGGAGGSKDPNIIVE